MISPKPSGKMNLLHQQILAGLLANKTAVRYEVRGRYEGPRNRKVWTETTVAVAIPTLAGNVSDDSLNRMAEGWAA